MTQVAEAQATSTYATQPRAIFPLVLNRVAKHFGAKMALTQLSLTFSPGTVSAVLGENGAGKSTLIGLLSTLVEPTRGKITWGQSGRYSAQRGKIGLLGHEPMLYRDLSALENLQFFSELYGLALDRTAIVDRLAAAGLDSAAAALPVRIYSRGMVQRAALARALLHNPELILLDEPFTGLDPAGQKLLTGVISGLRDSGHIVVLVSHDFAHVAELADRLIVLRRGRVAGDQFADSVGAPGSAPRFSHEQIATIYAEANRTT